MIYFIGAVIWGIIWGIVCNKVIENKGYDENWFWWGFFFGFIAFIVALTKSDNHHYYEQVDQYGNVKTDIKQDGKPLKKAPTLNQVLEERGVDYRIKEFETTRYIDDGNGNKKKKKYKNAWKIIRF